MQEGAAVPGRFSHERLTNPAAPVAILVCALLIGASELAAQPARSERVAVEYARPADPVHEPLYDMLKEHRALERVRELLLPIRWPRTLRLELKSCEGESNAWYENAVVTICYEYLDDMWRSANSSKRPPQITREDAFVGPFADTILHESGHALFDLLKIPLLGREEDAADQVAAYLILQLPKEKRRKLIFGAAYAYARELKVRRARDLSRPRLGFGRHITYADEHGTPAQRLYNLLCIAYGSDRKLFADVVVQGFLPTTRADMCEDEYHQIDLAYRKLIAPHMDSAPTAAPAKGWPASSLKALRARGTHMVAPVMAPPPHERPR
jgi:hypothetical protein